jgi:hypothetical protein
VKSWPKVTPRKTSTSISSALQKSQCPTGEKKDPLWISILWMKFKLVVFELSKKK